MIELSPKNSLPPIVYLPASKSLANRLLILRAITGAPLIKIENEPDDVAVLRQGILSKSTTINVGPAGTAMRFLTAFFACQTGAEVILTGSERMMQRPIAPLVQALQNLGAEIEYVGKSGFTPLKIFGKKLKGGIVEIKADVSSQFITALMLVAPTFERGLEIVFQEKPVSFPYLKMTAGIMQQCGFRVQLSEQLVKVLPQNTKPVFPQNVEADWSAAAFFMGLVANSPGSKIFLPGLKINSLQGDVRGINLFQELGVATTKKGDGVEIEHRPILRGARFLANLENTPDLAQPIAFTCAALGMSADLRGLKTLRLKETDRILAIKNELEKVGVSVQTTPHSLSFKADKLSSLTQPFATYHDHRMAMSAAILSRKFPIKIENPEVVSKSFPNFWDNLR